MMSVQGPILVTGATGKQGGAVAHELLQRGHEVHALTRKPASAAAQELERQGARIVQGDLNDAASLQRALAGKWGVFGLQNTWEAGVEQEEEQGKRLAEAARQASVQHYVYTSVGSAHRRTGIPHFDNKSRVEDRVRALAFPSHVILRPVFFMENFVSPWFKPAIDQGQLMIALEPTTVLQMIAVQDVGKYGLLAFEKHAELNRAEIDIAGDALTMPATAAALSEAAGRPISFVKLPIEAVRQNSEDYALMLEWFDRVGYDADIAGNAQRYGIAPTSFREWAATVDWSVAPPVSA
jgi:uncharacterized protein YbjT (DUF2867 family)